MATYRLRRLCRPDILRAIDSRYLGELLAPHASYLEKRGVLLPLEGRDAPLKQLALAQLLMSPDAATPRELRDALYFVDEMATPSKVQALVSAARARGIRWYSHLDLTPAEVVLQFWLRDPLLVQRIHAELATKRARAFDYFQPQSVRVPDVPTGLSGKVRKLEEEANDALYQRGCGRYVQIHFDEQEDSLWFSIGHGGMLRREAAVENDAPSTVCYRPCLYDSVVFVRLTGELGIHARQPWEKQLYQRLFGKHLFGDEQLFSGVAKYTLDPLRVDGDAALRCEDVPGIEWVRLGELRVFRPTHVPRSECFRASDLFKSWLKHRLPFPPDAHLLSGGFHIKLYGCAKPCWLTIRPSNHAQYSRDVDPALFETWLARRGFVRERKGGGHAEPGTFLAVA